MLLERAIGPEATLEDDQQDSRPWHTGMGGQGRPILSAGPVS